MPDSERSWRSSFLTCSELLVTLLGRNLAEYRRRSPCSPCTWSGRDDHGQTSFVDLLNLNHHQHLNLDTRVLGLAAVARPQGPSIAPSSANFSSLQRELCGDASSRFLRTCAAASQRNKPVTFFQRETETLRPLYAASLRFAGLRDKRPYPPRGVFRLVQQPRPGINGWSRPLTPGPVSEFSYGNHPA